MSGWSFWMTAIQVFFQHLFSLKQDFSLTIKYPKYRPNLFFLMAWFSCNYICNVLGFWLLKTILIIPFGDKSILIIIWMMLSAKKAYSKSYNFLTNLDNTWETTYLTIWKATHCFKILPLSSLCLDVLLHPWPMITAKMKLSIFLTSQEKKKWEDSNPSKFWRTEHLDLIVWPQWLFDCANICGIYCPQNPLQMHSRFTYLFSRVFLSVLPWFCFLFVCGFLH